MSGITDEFRKAMSDWVELKVQLVEARKDMKVLNDREKELKQFIKKVSLSELTVNKIAKEISDVIGDGSVIE